MSGGQTYGCTTILSVYDTAVAHTVSYRATSLGVPLHPLHHRLLTVRLQLVVLSVEAWGVEASRRRSSRP